MSKSEFNKLTKQFETGSTEFKESFDKEAIETAAAFANTKGGYILIGVSDKGKIKGVQLGKETIKDWVNQITQKIDPRIIPEIQIHTIEKKNVVSILIKEYPIKPVFIKGRCFRRVGNSNRIMTTQEVAQMHFLSSGMSWDKLPARDALIKDLSLVKIKKFIKRANETGRRKIQPDEESLQILKKMELIKNGKPTWAAILLFGNKPNRFLSQATIHCGRFKEEIIVIDDRMIYGDIIDQIYSRGRFSLGHFYLHPSLNPPKNLERFIMAVPKAMLLLFLRVRHRKNLTILAVSDPLWGQPTKKYSLPKIYLP